MVEWTQITSGLIELELWLQDLIRKGLARTQKEPPTFWQAVAARMIDAGIPNAAWELRRIAALPKNEPDWLDRLLWHLSRLFLLTQAAPHYPHLSQQKQADLLHAIGAPMVDRFLSPHLINDCWVHLGEVVQREDHYLQRRSWLWGIHSNQPLLIIEKTAEHKLPPSTITPTYGYDATAQFYYSDHPIEGIMLKKRQIKSTSLIGFNTVRAALNQYSTALSQRPWLRYYPFPITQLIPYRHNDQWWVQDLEGIALPLPPDWRKGWQLLALSGGTPLWLFGEWNGRYLNPLSCYHKQNWHLIHSWQHIS